MRKERHAGMLAALVLGVEVASYGWLDLGARTIRRALAVQPLVAVQSEYSRWPRGGRSTVSILTEWAAWPIVFE